MIEFRDVSFSYDGADRQALSGVSFTIHKGSLVAIMGSNGSGKSTAVLCMNGLLAPTEGTVLVDGLDTAQLPNGHHIRRRVGVVFQDPNNQFTSMTVERELAFGLENAGISRNEMHQRVDGVCERFDIEQVRSYPPSGLSGGEKQRVALASVVILRPRYLILDEGTSLLSPDSRKRILDDVIRETRSIEGTVILVTQFPGEAQMADRLMVFHEGRVAVDDRPEIVFSRPNELARIGVPLPATDRILVNGF